ncbi:MAG: cupin domain-containing protein [Verrucomicrobiota bacterium]
MLIGAKLKVVRKSKGLSLRALAELSDVTVGTLSQMENDNTSPSVGTLKRVLKALGMSMGEFFDIVESNESRERVTYPKENQVNVSPIEGLTLLGIPRSAREQKIQLLAETYKPGTSTGREYYSHEGEECGICLEGEVELHVDGHTYTLKPGDIYYFDSQKQHRFTNIGNKEAKIISACTPSSF